MKYFWYNYANIFFIHTTNYFSNVYRSTIIFSLGRELFFAVLRICLLACNTLRALQLKGTGSSVVDFLGERFENCAIGGVLSKRMQRRNIVRERNERGFHLFFQNLRGASGLCESDEVFWTEDLIEETTKLLQDSYTRKCLPKWTVPYPVSYLESRTIHGGFVTKTLNMRATPTLNIRKKLPILIQTGGHNKHSQMDSR